MAPQPEDDGNLPIPKKMERAHDVVARLHLMVDVLNSRLGRGKERDRVVHFVDAQERGVADPVADARVAHLRPEGLVPHRVGRAEAHMAEARHARVALAVIAPPAMGGPPDEFDRIAGRVAEADEVAHLARLRLLSRAARDLVAQPLERRGGCIEIGSVGDLEGDDVICRIALEITERVLALVRFEIDRAACPLRDFEGENVGGETRRAL